MVLIYLKDGECIEVREATAAVVSDGELMCFNDRGACVATFESGTVEAYTSNPFWAEEIKEEICQDLTVVSAQEPPSQQVP